MGRLYAVESLESYVDGDTIVPDTGYSFNSPGQAAEQFYNPSTQACSPDWSNAANQFIIYPRPFSSLEAKHVAPDSIGMQWYANSITDAGSILDTNGAVKSNWAAKVQKTTIEADGVTYPALKIIGNFASVSSLNTMNLYFVSTYNGITITCKFPIYIRESTGDAFDINVTALNGDFVIDNDTDKIVATAGFSNAGVAVNLDAAAWSWKKATDAGLVSVANVAGVTEINGNVLTLYDGAVEGQEEYYACATYNGKAYMKGFVASDTHDPYYIDKGKSSAGTILKKTENMTYTPKVRKRSDNSEVTGYYFKFTMRTNAGVVIDTDTNVASHTVAGTLVSSSKGVTVQISANITQF
ncbi:hypothetical protein [uncultured Bacteroides sp.]|uniref:hypothetical protein n=1 Tax=uncultured Bacteroides sp. TaxID=162156 RepID=UPI002AAAA75C|nr:hypothetical protein [uncultured Bacteroides sp.]